MSSGLELRRHLRQFVAYGLNGILAALVYSAVVWSLLALWPHQLVVAVVVAYAASTVVNYLGARKIFEASSSFREHRTRYLMTAAGAFALTTGLAWVIDRLDVPTLIAAYLPPILAAIPTFFVLRHWVFAATEPTG